jgi:hypothetical protein
MLSSFQSLTSTLNDSEVVVENHRDRFFRLSMPSNILFFDEALFSFEHKLSDLPVTSKIPIFLVRKSFATALGTVKAHREEFQISLNLAAKIVKLHSDTFSAENEEALKTEDAYKKGLHQNPLFMALGLRGLIRREAGNMKVPIHVQTITE